MHAFLQAARQFEATSRTPVRFYDLGTALLLEFYSVAWLKPDFVGLRLDTVLPRQPRVEEFAPLLTELDSAAQVPEVEEAFMLIGRGLTYRHCVLLSIRKLVIAMVISALLLHAVFLGAAIRAFLVSGFFGGALIIGGWFLSVWFATGICRAKLHWRPRARLRRNLS